MILQTLQMKNFLEKRIFFVSYHDWKVQHSISFLTSTMRHPNTVIEFS